MDCWAGITSATIAARRAPHIVRVDPQLDFDEIAEMGAMPFPSCDIWRGQLLAPTTGDYEFTIDVDDSDGSRLTARR